MRMVIGRALGAGAVALMLMGCDLDPEVQVAEVCDRVCDCLYPLGDTNRQCQESCEGSGAVVTDDACLACVRDAACHQMSDCFDLCF